MASKVFRKLQCVVKSTDFRAATKIVEQPLVAPEKDEIRVKNIYAGLNATDINITAGRYDPTVKVPFDIGLEALGLVDEIGSAVPADKLKVGQPVLVFGRAKSDGFSEYLYKKIDSLIPVPELKPDYLVSLVNGLTASIALDKSGRVQKDDKVLITAAAGGTGQIAVQWAKKKGAYVIALTSSEQKANYLKELGADLIINYKKEDLDKVLKEKCPEGIDVIWETIGGDIFKTLFEHLAVKGRMVIIGSVQTYKTDGLKDVPIENLNAKLLFNSKSLNGFMLLNWVEEYPEYLKKLIQMIASKELKTKVDLGEQAEGGQFFGIDQIARAEEHLHSGKNLGKVVVQLQKP